MKRTLPLASMEKILRTCGADRVSEGSKEKLKNYLEEYAKKISKDASEFAGHAGRKTIKSSDIILAIKK